MENKTGKYFKYAIGEIILVVIGILIALQVNNWNQNRLVQKEKEDILLKLHSDFIENKKIVNDYKISSDKEMMASIALMKLVGASQETLSNHNIDSLLYVSLGASEIAFADNTVKSIVQNANLNLFKDDTISELLYKWNSLSEIRKNRNHKLDSWANEQILPFLLDKISFKEMDMQSDYVWAGKSKVKPDYYVLFQTVEFENYYDNYLWLMQNLRERIQETEILIDDIIDASKP
ncbi:hypothetical protein [Formosa maritima]|nr:hypothetical protein [Formosa maritima]